MGSRVRIAAAACVMASGLFVGGASGALAFAVPALDSLGPDEGDGTKAEPAQKDETNSPPRMNIGEQNSAKGEVEQGKPHSQKPADQKPADGRPVDQKPEDQKPEDQKPEDQKPVDEKPDEKPDGGDPLPRDPDDEPEQGGVGEGEATPTKEPEPSETVEPPPPKEEPEPSPCEVKSDDDCGPGWPWWPWPWPGPPLRPGDSDGREQTEVPAGRPQMPPLMRLPAHLPENMPEEPAVINAELGVGVAASEGSLAPITLPIIVAPPPVIAGGGAPQSLPPEPGSPPGSSAERPAGRQAQAAETGSIVNVPPASYRVGYTDYLRTAGISQVVALAVPGLAGMLVLTGAGGLVGYRQAKAGHAVRAGGTARFVN